MVYLRAEFAREYARYAGYDRLAYRCGCDELHGRERARGPDERAVEQQSAKALQGNIPVVTRQETDR